MRLSKTFSAWKKEDQDAQIILLQKKFIYLLTGICLLCFTGWMTSPSRMTFYLPPDISNGATLKAGEIPNPLIYSFAYEVWQEINTWPQEGTQDYQSNIHTYWPYLTPEFKGNLLQNYQSLKENGQIERQRFLQGITGAAYDSSNVKKLNSDTWEVDLKMHLMEYKNNQVVKDVEILYPLKVTRMNISQQDNPYGLAIAGYTAQPIRLKTII